MQFFQERQTAPRVCCLNVGTSNSTNILVIVLVQELSHQLAIVNEKHCQVKFQKVVRSQGEDSLILPKMT